VGGWRLQAGDRRGLGLPKEMRAAFAVDAERSGSGLLMGEDPIVDV
jgi:hypothetical protein